MRRQLLVATAFVALASCTESKDTVDSSAPRGVTPPASSSPDTISTTTSSAPAPSTTVAPPVPTVGTTATLVAGLAGEYHQTRRLGTPTEEMRVLLLHDDATYEFWIEPIGYFESGSVVADPSTIEFVADTVPDADLGFAGRGVAAWTIDAADFASGSDLALQFPDGRGYGYDGYDRGVDLYFVEE